MIRIALVAALIAALLSAPIAAQGSEQVSSSMAGPGATTVVPAGEPDANGLVTYLSEPNAHDDVWAAIVVNATGAPISNVSVTFEIQIDDQWYIADVPGTAMAFPVTLQPGEFGVAVLGELGFGDEDWDDTRLPPRDHTPEPAPPEPAGVVEDWNDLAG